MRVIWQMDTAVGPRGMEQTDVCGVMLRPRQSPSRISVAPRQRKRTNRFQRQTNVRGNT